MQNLSGVSLNLQASLYASLTVTSTLTKVYTIQASPSVIFTASAVANWHWTLKSNVNLVCSLNAIPAGTIAIARANLGIAFNTTFIRRRRDNRPIVNIQDIIPLVLKPIVQIAGTNLVLKPVVQINGTSLTVIKPKTGIHIKDE
jgi:hypothetical protein